MKKFSYKAKTKDGKVIKGLVEANTQEQAVKLLHEKKLVVFSLSSKTQKTLLDYLDIFQRVSTKDITQLTGQLATMIDSGLTLTASLNIIQEQSRPAMAKLVGQIVRKIEGGSSFYQALEEYPDVFSKAYISLVKSGESSGKLDKILKELSASLEEQESFKRKIKGAMVYPLIIISGMVIVIIVMLIFVIPKMSAMYEEMELNLPLPTQILISLSNFMVRFWYIGVSMIILGLYFFRKWRKTSQGKQVIDSFILKIPLIGKLVSKIVLTQIVRTLAMLINAGVPILESLNIVSEVANNYVFESSIIKASKQVERGFSLTEALGKYEEYPVVLIQMLSVGEQTGKIGDVLIKVADNFEAEADTAVKSLTTAIEPLMMVVVGIGVGFIVISIITPIYNLTSQF